MRTYLDTSAFLPANTPAGQWQRFDLEFPDEEAVRRVRERREDIQEACNRTGRWAKARAYDRAIVRRYGV